MKRVLSHFPTAEFILCVGDDKTDEDMFTALGTQFCISAPFFLLNASVCRDLFFLTFRRVVSKRVHGNDREEGYVGQVLPGEAERRVEAADPPRVKQPLRLERSDDYERFSLKLRPAQNLSLICNIWRGKLFRVENE